MDEIWKPAVGYEGYFEVSSFGRVKSLERKVVCGENRFRTVKERIMTPSLMPNGYLVVTLSAAPMPRKTEAVHRLVANAFLGKRPSGQHVVNHINANKADNRISNLEWVTPVENCKHAQGLSLLPKGESHGSSKLKRKQVKNIMRRVLAGENRKKIAKEYGVSSGSVDAIMQGRVWRHLLPDGYEPPEQVVTGENNPMSKLTKSEVLAIRAEYAKGGVSQKALAAKYGVTQTCVGGIVRRASWSHI